VSVPRRPIGARPLWLVGALLQLLLPGAAAWADAQLDAAGAHAKAHVESHTTSSCARIHPPDCALCQFLGAPGLPTPPISPQVGPARVAAAGPAEPARLRPARSRSHPQPRAPPTLS